MLVAAPDARLGAQERGTRERTAFVSALDARGFPIEALAPDDLIVREDGVRREVLRVSRATAPMDLAVLVDNSEAARAAVVDLRRSVASFLGQVSGGNSVALFGLAARPTILVDYTSDAARLQQAIGRMFPQTDTGMTLLDALTEVSTGMARRESTRSTIVAIVTDGIEFSNKDGRSVINTLKKNGVAFHAVTIGTFPIRNEMDRERAIVLEAGTRETGGAQHSLLASTGLDMALQQVARELTSQFAVVYARPESLIPPETFEIAGARPGMTVRGMPARGQGN